MIVKEVNIDEKDKAFDQMVEDLRTKPSYIMINGIWYYREDKLFDHIKDRIINIFSKKEKK